MFTYKLSYIDIGYQNREIVTLVRTNAETKAIECIRASAETSTHSNYAHKRLNFCANADVKILNERFADHCSYCENILGATSIDEQATEIVQLWSEIMGLVNRQFVPYPVIILTTFVGEAVNTRGGLSGFCNNLEITNPGPTQAALIDGIFDKAMRTLPQTDPVLPPEAFRSFFG